MGVRKQKSSYINTEISVGANKWLNYTCNQNFFYYYINIEQKIALRTQRNRLSLRKKMFTFFFYFFFPDQQVVETRIFFFLISFKTKHHRLILEKLEIIFSVREDFNKKTYLHMVKSVNKIFAISESCCSRYQH